MLCASHSATAIRVTMDDNEVAPECLSSLLSSSSSNSPTNPSSSSSGLGRAIDRHNPIIRDGRRISTTSSTSRRTNNTSLLIPTPSSTRASSSSSTTATTHKINHMTNTKLVTGASEFSEVLANNNKKKKKKKKSQNTDTISTITSVHSGGGSNSSSGGGGGGAVINRKKQVSSQGGGWGCKNPGDFISPRSFSSSRYLLSSHEDAGFLSDDPIIASEPVLTASKSSLQLPAANFNKLDEHQFSPPLAPTSYIPVKPPPPPSPSSDPSQHQQVVVLKVSLHCRGCERKMRKHISRMEGVTSFDIDFAAKKVMVVGNVTPLAVLASVSKVKNAQLLNPTISTSSPPTVAKASNYSGTVKRQGIVV